ncbi:MAG TPA: hypothetical protein VFP94_08870 [Terriglobales bacterium]|nr:hypothetical protein [Terriglobales bacterium]
MPVTRVLLRVLWPLLLPAAAALTLPAQAPPATYPRMAPAAQYMIGNRAAEIALARSAAPASISGQAEVMVLGTRGFEVAAPGSNKFVCLVERSWDAAMGDPNFWNPHIRGPDCFNPAAVQSYLPIILLKTRLALAGRSQAEIAAALTAAFRQGKLPPLAAGAMSYMLSRRAYVDDHARNWHPHVMFFLPLALARSWAAGSPGSPLLAGDDPTDRLTIVMIPVARWSDGTPDVHAAH